MTAPADDSAVEEAFEAYLAGRAVPSAGDRLASFADAVRASATEPGRPSAALAGLLANGLLTDQPGPSARTARRPRRRRSRMLAPAALFTKLATAGLAAKAATVAGVAVVGLTTVGFTGNLGPAQHGFATLVDQATPFTAPDPTTQQGTGTTDPTSGTDQTSSGTDQTSTTGDGTAPATPTPFGQSVSQMAHADKAAGSPGVDGQAISSMAHSRHSGQTGDATSADDGTDGSSASPAAPTTSGTGHGTSSGKGHGHR